MSGKNISRNSIHDRRNSTSTSDPLSQQTLLPQASQSSNLIAELPTILNASTSQSLKTKLEEQINLRFLAGSLKGIHFTLEKSREAAGLNSETDEEILSVAIKKEKIRAILDNNWKAIEKELKQAGKNASEIQAIEKELQSVEIRSLSEFTNQQKQHEEAQKANQLKELNEKSWYLRVLDPLYGIIRRSPELIRQQFDIVTGGYRELLGGIIESLKSGDSLSIAWNKGNIRAGNYIDEYRKLKHSQAKANGIGSILGSAEEFSKGNAISDLITLHPITAYANPIMEIADAVYDEALLATTNTLNKKLGYEDKLTYIELKRLQSTDINFQTGKFFFDIAKISGALALSPAAGISKSQVASALKSNLLFSGTIATGQELVSLSLPTNNTEEKNILTTITNIGKNTFTNTANSMGMGGVTDVFRKGYIGLHRLKIPKSNLLNPQHLALSELKTQKALLSFQAANQIYQTVDDLNDTLDSAKQASLTLDITNPLSLLGHALVLGATTKDLLGGGANDKLQGTDTSSLIAAMQKSLLDDADQSIKKHQGNETQSNISVTNNSDRLKMPKDSSGKILRWDDFSAKLDENFIDKLSQENISIFELELIYNSLIDIANNRPSRLKLVCKGEDIIGLVSSTAKELKDPIFDSRSNFIFYPFNAKKGEISSDSFSELLNQLRLNRHSSRNFGPSYMQPAAIGVLKVLDDKEHSDTCTVDFLQGTYSIKNLKNFLDRLEIKAIEKVFETLEQIQKNKVSAEKVFPPNSETVTNVNKLLQSMRTKIISFDNLSQEDKTTLEKSFKATLSIISQKKWKDISSLDFKAVNSFCRIYYQTLKNAQPPWQLSTDFYKSDTSTNLEQSLNSYNEIREHYLTSKQATSRYSSIWKQLLLSELFKQDKEKISIQKRVFAKRVDGDQIGPEISPEVTAEESKDLQMLIELTDAYGYQIINNSENTNYFIFTREDIDPEQQATVQKNGKRKKVKPEKLTPSFALLGDILHFTDLKPDFSKTQKLFLEAVIKLSKTDFNKKEDVINLCLELLELAEALLKEHGVEYELDETSIKIKPLKNVSPMNTYAYRLWKKANTIWEYDPLLVINNIASFKHKEFREQISHLSILFGKRCISSSHERVHIVSKQIEDFGGNGLFFGNVEVKQNSLLETSAYKKGYSFEEIVAFVAEIKIAIGLIKKLDFQKSEEIFSEIQEYIDIVSDLTTDLIDTIDNQAIPYITNNPFAFSKNKNKARYTITLHKTTVAVALGEIEKYRQELTNRFPEESQLYNLEGLVIKLKLQDLSKVCKHALEKMKALASLISQVKLAEIDSNAKLNLFSQLERDSSYLSAFISNNYFWDSISAVSNHLNPNSNIALANENKISKPNPIVFSEEVFRKSPLATITRDLFLKLSDNLGVEQDFPITDFYADNGIVLHQTGNNFFCHPRNEVLSFITFLCYQMSAKERKSEDEAPGSIFTIQTSDSSRDVIKVENIQSSINFESLKKRLSEVFRILIIFRLDTIISIFSDNKSPSAETIRNSFFADLNQDEITLIEKWIKREISILNDKESFIAKKLLNHDPKAIESYSLLLKILTNSKNLKDIDPEKCIELINYLRGEFFKLNIFLNVYLAIAKDGKCKLIDLDNQQTASYLNFKELVDLFNLLIEVRKTAHQIYTEENINVYLEKILNLIFDLNKSQIYFTEPCFHRFKELRLSPLLFYRDIPESHNPRIINTDESQEKVYISPLSVSSIRNADLIIKSASERGYRVNTHRWEAKVKDGDTTKTITTFSLPFVLEKEIDNQINPFTLFRYNENHVFDDSELLAPERITAKTDRSGKFVKYNSLAEVREVFINQLIANNPEYKGQEQELRKKYFGVVAFYGENQQIHALDINAFLKLDEVQHLIKKDSTGKVTDDTMARNLYLAIIRHESSHKSQQEKDKNQDNFQQNELRAFADSQKPLLERGQKFIAVEENDKTIISLMEITDNTQARFFLNRSLGKIPENSKKPLIAKKDRSLETSVKNYSNQPDVIPITQSEKRLKTPLKSNLLIARERFQESFFGQFVIQEMRAALARKQFAFRFDQKFEDRIETDGNISHDDVCLETITVENYGTRFFFLRAKDEFLACISFLASKLSTRAAGPGDFLPSNLFMIHTHPARTNSNSVEIRYIQTPVKFAGINRAIEKLELLFITWKFDLLLSELTKRRSSSTTEILTINLREIFMQGISQDRQAILDQIIRNELKKFTGWVSRYEPLETVGLEKQREKTSKTYIEFLENILLGKTKMFSKDEIDSLAASISLASSKVREVSFFSTMSLKVNKHKEPYLDIKDNLLQQLSQKQLNVLELLEIYVLLNDVRTLSYQLHSDELNKYYFQTATTKLFKSGFNAVYFPASCFEAQATEGFLGGVLDLNSPHVKKSTTEIFEYPAEFSTHKIINPSAKNIIEKIDSIVEIAGQNSYQLGSDKIKIKFLDGRNITTYALPLRFYKKPDSIKIENHGQALFNLIAQVTISLSDLTSDQSHILTKFEEEYKEILKSAQKNNKLDELNAISNSSTFNLGNMNPLELCRYLIARAPEEQQAVFKKLYQSLRELNAESTLEISTRKYYNSLIDTLFNAQNNEEENKAIDEYLRQGRASPSPSTYAELIVFLIHFSLLRLEASSDSEARKGVERLSLQTLRKLLREMSEDPKDRKALDELLAPRQDKNIKFLIANARENFQDSDQWQQHIANLAQRPEFVADVFSYVIEFHLFGVRPGENYTIMSYLNKLKNSGQLNSSNQIFINNLIRILSEHLS